MTRYTDQTIRWAWEEAKKGRRFSQALGERNYGLASGYVGIVIVDPEGKIFNPTRHLDGVSAKAIKKMVGNEAHLLPDATVLSNEIQRRRHSAYQEREQQRREREAHLQNRLQDRQLAERSATFDRIQTKIEKETERLAEHHRIREQREAIADLERKAPHSSWWRRFTGKDMEDWAKLETLYQDFDDATEIINDHINYLEARRDRDMSEIEERHQRERQQLVDRRFDDRPTQTVPNPARSREKSGKTDRDFDR